MNLALFDLDGTITRKDSFIEFIRYYHGEIESIIGIIRHLPWLFAMKCKLIPNWKVKEMFLTYFFKGEIDEKFITSAKQFSEKYLPLMIREAALVRINDHLKKGDRIIIVSASIEDWIKPWCDQLGIELIATRLKREKGMITGLINGANCYGFEKVKRIKEKVDLAKYDLIYAYGDSKGDLQMLELADHKFYKRF